MDDSYNVYDGAHIGTNCTDINKVQFSYNVAVWLLGAANMYNYVSVFLIPALPPPLTRLTDQRIRHLARTDVVAPQQHPQHLFPRQHRLRGRLRTQAHVHHRHVLLQGLPHPVARGHHVCGAVDPRTHPPQAKSVRHCGGSSVRRGHDWPHVWPLLVQGSGLGRHPGRGAANGGDERGVCESPTAASRRATIDQHDGWNEYRQPQRRQPECSGSSGAETGDARRPGRGGDPDDAGAGGCDGDVWVDELVKMRAWSL
jgi:hypothetical protein